MVFEEHFKAFFEGLSEAFEFFGIAGKPSTFSLEEIRENFTRAYTKWTEDEDSDLEAASGRANPFADWPKCFRGNPAQSSGAWKN